MSSFVVAVEYTPNLTDLVGGVPRTLHEHAYDLQAAALAGHVGQVPRLTFPYPQRGWPSPAVYPRCVTCTDAVDAIVAAFIAATVAGLRPELSPPRRPILSVPPPKTSGAIYE